MNAINMSIVFIINIDISVVAKYYFNKVKILEKLTILDYFLCKLPQKRYFLAFNIYNLYELN